MGELRFIVGRIAHSAVSDVVGGIAFGFFVATFWRGVVLEKSLPQGAQGIQGAGSGADCDLKRKIFTTGITEVTRFPGDVSALLHLPVWRARRLLLRFACLRSLP